MMGSRGDVKVRTFSLTREHTGDGRDIGQMSSAAEWIVQNGDVARFQIERTRGVLDRERHRAQMDGHVIAHGDGFAGCIVDGARIIAPLFNIRRE